MSRRKLKEPTIPVGEKAYCGAYSLMAVTGKSLAVTRRQIREANGWSKTRSIRGLYTSELVRGFRHAGIQIEKVIRPDVHRGTDVPTLARWLRERKADEKRGMFLVVLTGHFVMVRGNDFIDTHTRSIVKVDNAPHRRARVLEVWRVK